MISQAQSFHGNSQGDVSTIEMHGAEYCFYRRGLQLYLRFAIYQKNLSFRMIDTSMKLVTMKDVNQMLVAELLSSQMCPIAACSI